MKTFASSPGVRPYLCTGRRAVACVPALIAGWLLLTASAVAHAQTAAPVDEPAPAAAPAAPGVEAAPWCGLPLCREAEGLRRAQDWKGALRLYRYIHDEVNVDEKQLKKPLLWFLIAALHDELQQTWEGLEALHRYEKHIAPLKDADLPYGQRRDDVERLLHTLRARIGVLRVAVKDAGVRVLVDGKEAGTTPLAAPLELPPGRHRVEIAGALRETRDLELAAGQELVLWPLRPPAAPLPVAGGLALGKDAGPRPSRPAWRIAVGAVAIGAGITLLALGASALAVDGHCSSTTGTTGGGGDPRGACPIVLDPSGQPVMHVIDSKAAGGSMIGVGLVAAAAGAVIIALPARKRPLRAALHLDNHGAGLGLAASF